MERRHDAKRRHQDSEDERGRPQQDSHSPRFRDPSHQQDGRKRPGAGGGLQQPQRGGADMQHLAGKRRHHPDVGPAEETKHQERPQKPPHPPVRAQQLNAFAEIVRQRSARWGLLRRHGHDPQGGHDREKRRRIQVEAPRLAGGGNDHAAQRRAKNPRPIESHGVERDSRQHFAFLHQLRHQRMPRRDVKRLHQRVERTQHQHLPDLNTACGREQPQHTGADQQKEVGGEQHPAAVHTVGGGAADQREHQPGHRLSEGQDPQVEGRLGKPVDEIPQRDKLHPGPGVRDHQPDPQQPEVAMP